MAQWESTFSQAGKITKEVCSLSPMNIACRPVSLKRFRFKHTRLDLVGTCDQLFTWASFWDNKGENIFPRIHRGWDIIVELTPTLGDKSVSSGFVIL